MTDPSLLPTSYDTASRENTSSDSSSAQPLSTLAMNRSGKVGNENHRGMKSRHLTMIGMYSSYSGTASKPSFASSWWNHRYRNILDYRNRASIQLTFILLHGIDGLSHQGRIDRRSCKCTSLLLCSGHIRLLCCNFSVS